MRVGFFQQSVVHKNKEANLEKAASAVTDLKADLIVLPELFNVGYIFEKKEELADLAENVQDGKTVRALADLASKEKCCIIAGIAERHDLKLYNTAVIVNENGCLGSYRKIHLTKYEKQFFSPGNQIKTFELNGIRIGVEICFDLWFPEISRELMLRGTDILCVPANFGGPLTPKIAVARAAENMIYTVLCNRTGGEPEADFIGESMVIDPYGSILAGGNQDIEETVCIQIDPVKARKKSGVLCDDLFAELKLQNDTI